ncbi:Presenilin homolog [Strongyloides ratti]|uniref:Presenilin n=1 Tax=Strongyloides ratti TaxID=34506 RepID=A0A090MWD3_STRRB|nr:Presenilin homolog [Strongyloides ratti]CEF63639.1 Presenilin homolog [Strongyloides ratti]
MTDDSSKNFSQNESKYKPKRQKNDESRYNISKRLNTVIDLYIPITICIVCALIIEKYLEPFSNVVSLINVIMYGTVESITKAKASQYNGSMDSIPSITKMIIIAVCFIGFVVIMTSLLVFLYVKGYRKWIEYFFWVQLFVSFMVTETKIIASIFTYFEKPIDDVLIILISTTFSIIGVFSINGFGPRKLRQFFHITLGVNISLLLVSMLPEWITWLILLLISIWDLVAVLWKKGPLNILVNTANDRNEEIFNALVYSCMAYPESAKEDITTKNIKINKDKNEDNNTKKSIKEIEKEYIYIEEEEEETNAKLGMGDFVFYTLISVHVSKYDDPISLVNCFVAILSGLTMTMFILVYFKRALPALPISIFSSIIFFFGTYYLGSPYYTEIIDKNIVI